MAEHTKSRAKDVAGSPGSARGLLVKLCLAVVVPVAFFVLLETGLRVAGFGRDVHFFVPEAGSDLYRANPRFTELFFPASFGLKPVNFRISKHKPAGSVRVFVLGGSAAMGVPEPAFALAQQLQVQLRAAHPGTQIEVYNLAITAINSHAVLEIARQAVDFEPDLLVIYMGNNEVVGPFGASASGGGGMPPRAFVRANLLLRTMRTGQLIGRITSFLGMRGSGNREWNGMETFAGKIVAADDPRLRTVRESFAANLDEILDLAERKGVRTVLSTVAVNVHDSSPFASVPAEPPAALMKADRAIDFGKYDQAADLTGEAAAAEPGHAEAQFRLARILESRGDSAAARDHYFKALEADALRFRADGEINAIIRSAAKAHPDHLILVDAARELGSDVASTVPLAGHELFFEHVHLTWEGDYALSRLIAGASARVLWGNDGSAASWLDRKACAHAVGYTNYGRLAQLLSMSALVGRPPFIGQWTFAADQSRLQRETAEARSALERPGAIRDAIEIVDAAVKADPTNPQLAFQAAAVHLQSGDYRGALALNDRYAELAPSCGEQAMQRAFLLQQLGRGGEAADILTAALAREPFYFLAYPLLAQLWVANNRAEHALEEFERLVQRMPENRVVRSTYAQLLARKGDWFGVEREWATLLTQHPDDEGVLSAFVERLIKTGRPDRAVDLMLRAYGSNNRSYANNSRLAQIFAEKGDIPNAVKYLKELRASGPVNSRYHIDLARNLAQVGRREEARVELQRAVDASKTEGDMDALHEAENLLQQVGN